MAEHRFFAVIAGGLAALVFALFFQGLSMYGVISLEAGRMFLAAAWLIATLAIIVSRHALSLPPRVENAGAILLPTLLAIFFFGIDRWATNKRIDESLNAPFKRAQLQRKQPSAIESRQGAPSPAPAEELPKLSPKRVEPPISMRLPDISIKTIEGLPLLNGGINADESTHLRLQRLIIINNNEFEIHNVCARLQLPEAIPEGKNKKLPNQNAPVWLTERWYPIKAIPQVVGTDGASATQTGGFVHLETATQPNSAVGIFGMTVPEPCFTPTERRPSSIAFTADPLAMTGVWQLEIDRIPPAKKVIKEFLTSNGPEASFYISRLADIPAKSRHGQPNIALFIEGIFQYEIYGKPTDAHFFVPVLFDESARKISSLETQSTNAGISIFMLN